MAPTHRSAALALLALLLPAVAGFLGAANSPAAMAAVGAAAAVLIAAAALHRADWVLAPVRTTGPRTSGIDHRVWISLEDPDSPGHPRPRAPGHS